MPIDDMPIGSSDMRPSQCNRQTTDAGNEVCDIHGAAIPTLVEF